MEGFAKNVWKTKVDGRWLYGIVEVWEKFEEGDLASPLFQNPEISFNAKKKKGKEKYS